MSEWPSHGRISQQAVQVAESFVALADSLVDDFDVVELLDRLVRDCVDFLGVSAAAIMLTNRDRVLEVVASSDEASRLMEVFQLESHAGPCIEAMRTGEIVAVNGTDELERRWPTFGHAVKGVGFASVYALPMRLREERFGALNLFDAGGEPLSEFDLRLGQAMADVATIAILQQRSISRSTELAEQLQLALTTRIVVEQAKGVLAEFGGVGMDVAFEALRDDSRRRRTKISAVAQSVVRRELEPGQMIRRRHG